MDNTIFCQKYFVDVGSRYKHLMFKMCRNISELSYNIMFVCSLITRKNNQVMIMTVIIKLGIISNYGFKSKFLEALYLDPYESHLDCNIKYIELNISKLGGKQTWYMPCSF